MKKIKCQGCGKPFQVGKYATKVRIGMITHLVRLSDKKNGILKWEGPETAIRFKFEMCGSCKHKILDFYEKMAKSNHYARYRRLKIKKGKMRISGH